MSLKTWKEEFYPVPASEASGSELEALRHGRLKWEGLHPLSLLRHGVHQKGSMIRALDGEFWAGSLSCALCERHLHPSPRRGCGTCSLNKLRGVPCDAGRGGDPAPWDQWIDSGNAEPMLDLIQRAIVLEVAHDARTTTATNSASPDVEGPRDQLGAADGQDVPGSVVADESLPPGEAGVPYSDCDPDTPNVGVRQPDELTGWGYFAIAVCVLSLGTAFIIMLAT